MMLLRSPSSSLSLSLLGATLSLLAAACSGNVVTDSTGAGGAATGTGAAGGGAGGAGGTDLSCGGEQGVQCDDGFFCAYPQPTACGCCDAVGVCIAKPLDCSLDCPGACGCDGQLYCNECLANLAGVGVDPLASCNDDNEKYSVQMLPTNAPRFALFKTSASPDRCFRIVVVGFGFGGAPDYDVETTSSWTIETITATNHASDCVLGAGGFPDPPQDQSAIATAAEGTIVISPPDLPCAVTADLALHFDASAPWIPATEIFDSGELKTEIPCAL